MSNNIFPPSEEFTSNAIIDKQRYEDMYSDIIGSKKWMDSDNPKWDRVYKRINRVAENTSRNSKLGGKKRKTRKNKKQFLYNPNDPSKSFDVYIDKNPKDTIPIKYTTVKDVNDTISKLEKLYKNKKYIITTFILEKFNT